MEVSPANRQKQWETLRCRPSETSAGTGLPSERPSAQPAAAAVSLSEAAQGSVDDHGPLAGISAITGAQACGRLSQPAP